MVDTKLTLINGERPSEVLGNPQEELKMKRTNWGYVAGTIDSDGCIGTQKNTNCKTYRPYLVVIQKDMKLIEYLYSNFGGSVNIVSRKRVDNIDFYIRWMVVNQRCVNILKKCLPYLIVKKEQAILAVRMVEEAKCGKQKGFRRIPEHIYDLQKDLHFSIKNLNSPATTERVGSLKKEMRQSELTEMKNRQREIRSGFSAE